MREFQIILLFFIKFCLVYTFDLYVDPSSILTSQDGSSSNPYKTLQQAFTASTTTGNIIMKSGTYINDLINDTTISQNLTLKTTDVTAVTLALNMNSRLLIKNALTLMNMIITRTGNQSISEVFQVFSASLTFINCTFKNIANDANLINFIILSSTSQITLSSVKLDSLTSNFSAFITSSYSNITIISMNIMTSTLYGSLINSVNTNITVNGLNIMNSQFFNSTAISYDFDGVLIPLSVNFIGVSFINSLQNVKSDEALFFYSNPSNYSYINFTFIKCSFSQISSINPLISINRNIAIVTFAFCIFTYNNGESLIFLSEILISVISSIQCISNNNPTDARINGLANACFNLRSTLIRLFDSMVIDQCVGLNAAGLKLYDNSTIITGFSTQVNISAFMNFTNCNYTNNYISFVDNGDAEIGTAIYVASSNYMNFTFCLFQNNTMNTTETLFKNGGSCINSIDLSQKMQIFFSNFIGNVARYYANCVMFVGALIDIESSLFKDNYPILSDDDLNNRENLGGALYILSEITVISNSKFLNNLNYNGGGLYINGNKNRALSNLLQYNNQWINNTAIKYGGSIFFDYDFIILNANITLDLFQRNWAKESGGAIFTQYSSDSAQILLYKCTLIENLSGLGGALALTHLIGLLAALNCDFIRNVASYMEMSDFISGVLPDSSDRGAGGALRIEGRIFTLFVSQQSNFIGNWAALRGGVLAGLPGNSTFLLNVFKGNHAPMAGTFYVGTFHFLYLVYSSIVGDYAEQTGASMVIKEFCLCYIQASYFQDCWSGQAQGVIVLSDEITTYVLSSTFVNISSQEGSIFYVTDIKSSPFVVQNMQVINCETIYSLISIYDSSNLAFISANFINNTGRVYSCQNCMMAILYNVIINNYCKFQNEIEACFLSASDGSSVAVNYTNGTNISNIKEGGSVYIVDSTLLLYTFRLILTESDNFGGCVMASSSILYTFNSVFENYIGGCFYLDTSNLTLVATSFNNTLINGMITSYGSTIACINCEVSTIIMCQFIGNSNNTALGGALYYENDIYNYDNFLFLQNCVFRNNYVGDSGGALYLSYQIANISLNLFNNNSAYIGGAIYYQEDLSFTSRFLLIFQNNFTNNSAHIEGGALKYTSKRPLEILLNLFKNNTAVYGPNLASYPVRIRLFDENDTKLYPYDTLYILGNEVSNSDISQSLRFGLFDTDDQECTLINTGQATISAVELNSTLTTNSTTNASDSSDLLEISGSLNEFIANGEFTFQDIQMKAFPPNKTFNLSILTDSTPVYYKEFLANLTPNEQNNTDIYSFVIPVYLRSCVIGEIYEKIYQGCYECEYSKYSLNTTDEICNPCPDNAICYGGKNISVYPGYWRSTITSLNIIKCVPYADSCLGGYDSGCAVGYVGPLCQTCDVFGPVIYRKSGLFQCTECGNETVNIFLLILASGLIFIFYIILIKSNVSKLKNITFEKDVKSKLNTNELSKKSKKEMHLSIFFRIFLNYLQIVALAQDFDLTWPDAIQNMFAIQYNLGNISQYMFSFDCFVKSESSHIPTIYLRALLTGLTPVMAMVFIVFFWIVYKIYKRLKWNEIKNSFLTTLLISSYFIQPTIINMMAKIVSCKEVDPGKFYITTFLYFQCYTEEHNRYVFYLAVPLLAIWVGLYPLSLFVYLYRSRSKLNSLELRKKLGFIYNGYNSDVYFWEFIVMLRKITIILVAAFLKYNAFARALVVLFILGISIYLQTLKKPFFTEVLNELEYRAIIVSLFTIYFGLFYYVTPDDYGKFLTIIVIITSNIYFLGYWFLQVLVLAVPYESLRKKLKCCPKLLVILDKIKVKIDQLDQYMSKKITGSGMERVKMNTSSQSGSVLRGEILSDSIARSNNDTSKIFPKKN